jgi:hypothetical protein
MYAPPDSKWPYMMPHDNLYLMLTCIVRSSTVNPYHYCTNFSLRVFLLEYLAVYICLSEEGVNIHIC